MDTIESFIRDIVVSEMGKQKQRDSLVPVIDFCKQKNISRVTLWRQEKSGKVKIIRIGKKTFVDTNQF